MMETSLGIAILMLSAAWVIAFVRLVIGPSLPDRVVALDLLTVQTVCIIAAFTIRQGSSVTLDPAIVLALIAFIGTVAYASYVERGSR